MLLCGIAIQIKTTAAFPGAFLGMTLIFMAHRAGWPYARILGAALLWAFIGLLPTIGAGVWYAVPGHLDAFLFANFWSKQYQCSDPAGSQIRNTATREKVGW